MDSAGLRWYRTGTVNITQGSTNITGVGTNWRTAGIQPGDVFMVGNSVLYEIAQVADNTNIVLNSAFQGATGTGQNYSIIRNFAGTMQAQIAAQVSELVNKYESYIDTELQQIVGPPGPTSFPYRGTWATGREYDALDVVEYSRLLYMAVAGHVSTSENAPGAANTEWMPLQVASGAVTTTFINGAAITPNGEYGVSIAGNAPNKNILTNITPTGITIQSEESGGTITRGTFSPDVDTGDITVAPSIQGCDIKYRVKNGICTLFISGSPVGQMSDYEIILGTLPDVAYIQNINFIGMLVISRTPVDLSIAGTVLRLILRGAIWSPGDVLFATVSYPTN